MRLDSADLPSREELYPLTTICLLANDKRQVEQGVTQAHTLIAFCALDGVVIATEDCRVRFTMEIAVNTIIADGGFPCIVHESKITARLCMVDNEGALICFQLQIAVDDDIAYRCRTT